MVLEPKKLISAPDTVDMELVQHLSKQVRANKFCQWVLRFASKEQINLFTDQSTHLDCKTKLDLNHRNRLIVDLKSTSQPTYERFVKSCLDYDYDGSGRPPTGSLLLRQHQRQAICVCRHCQESPAWTFHL